MATLDGNDNIRGYRYDRFYGKNTYNQTTDLRLHLGMYQNSFLSINIALFGGFDLSRVWLPGEKTNKWHNSFGGGLLFNAINQVALKTSHFTSSDGSRFVIGFGMRTKL